MCVDGLDQTPYRRGKASGGRAEARLLLRDGAAALDVLRGEVVSPVYPARHRRRIAFVDASYWVIEDLLESERPHAYSQRFHFAPEVGTIERSDRAAFTDWQGCGVALSSWPQCEAELETGFISRRYGEKQAAPVLALTQRGTAVSFVTLLAPRSAHEPSRQLRRVEIARLADGESRGIIAIDCGHDGARDWLAWSDAQETLLIAGFALDARHAWLRFDGRGRLVAGTALGARAIRAPNGDVLWCAATPLSAAARYDAETRAFVAADPEGAR